MELKNIYVYGFINDIKENILLFFLFAKLPLFMTSTVKIYLLEDDIKAEFWESNFISMHTNVKCKTGLFLLIFLTTINGILKWEKVRKHYLKNTFLYHVLCLFHLTYTCFQTCDIIASRNIINEKLLHKWQCFYF